MAQKSLPGGAELSQKIKQRRRELNLTIEEAAARAGVGMKTWSRYEAGAPIRLDKCKGVCRALNWRNLGNDGERKKPKSFAEEYENHEAWSPFLAENYGKEAAAAFASGSDILLDNIQQDLRELEALPAGSHLGQLDISFLREDLPPQFLMRYDYDFVYRMKCVLLALRRKAQIGDSLLAHSVMEELVIYLCSEQAKILMELDETAEGTDWVFDLFDDDDLIFFLYTDQYLTEDDPYHFANWNARQFYTGAIAPENREEESDD